MAFLKDTDISSKNIARLLEFGGLYIVKQCHSFFDIVSSE